MLGFDWVSGRDGVLGFLVIGSGLVGKRMVCGSQWRRKARALWGFRDCRKVAGFLAVGWWWDWLGVMGFRWWGWVMVTGIASGKDGMKWDGMEWGWIRD